MNSLAFDKSAHHRKFPPGTLRRIGGFAKPYRRTLTVFLVLVMVDAELGAINPLIFRAIIEQGILEHRDRLVIGLALAVAGLAVVDAGLGLWQRWVSARVGQGLIFDMRTKVFAHIEEMPIAFFTRTQTGALISRLNNDVGGAQSAPANTMSSVVSKVITVAITLAVMFYLSWEITLFALVMLPVFVVPTRWVGRRLATINRESYDLIAKMNTTMSERFNVAGALLVKHGNEADIDKTTDTSRQPR